MFWTWFLFNYLHSYFRNASSSSCDFYATVYWYIRKLNTGTACPTKSRRVYLYNVICIIPDFYFFFCNIFISWTKIWFFNAQIIKINWYIFSIKKWFLPMRWNVERDAGLLGTEEVWTPCDHNTDEMIRYQDILTKTFSQRSIHIYLQFLN